MDPRFMALTLAEIRTVAWLVENNRLSHLESLVLSSNLDMSSVSTELETIKRVVDQENISEATDETILGDQYQ